MTSTSSNREVGPIGAEVDEFLAPPTTPEPPAVPHSAAPYSDGDDGGEDSMSPLQAAVLDAADRPYADVAAAGLERVARAVPRAWSSVLRGDWLGHPLHPALTDFPLGCWTCASLLDVVGGRAARPAATRLVALGLLGVPVAAAAGLADWQSIDAETERRARRVGATHAVANVVAAVCYLLSWRARRSGRHTLGVTTALAGAAVTVFSGDLGGELVFGVPDRPSSSA